MTKTHAAFAVLAAMLAGSAAAHQEQAGPAPAAKGEQAPPAVDIPEKKTRDPRAYFPDLELLTQDGKKVRFYSDLLEGKTVLINVIYTSCKDACPLITQKLNEVRKQLGESFGREVYFVSISSDPLRDTPKALKKFAKAQSADAPGWSFVTGDRGNVQQILAKLGQLPPTPEDHSTLLLAGNVPQKRWTKLRPDLPSPALAERIRLLLDPDAFPGGIKPNLN